MTETLVAIRQTAATEIRAYRPADHGDCRRLWAELACEHRELYGLAAPAEDDPGAAFEEYLTRLDLSGMWVAEDPHAKVVGMVGLILDGQAGEVEPVVVTRAHRGERIGRALLAYVADQARARGLRQLTISPMARNLDAIRCLHAAGYDELTRITLAIDLTSGGDGRDDTEGDGVALHGVTFRY